jgi:hypothetical protein
VAGLLVGDANSFIGTSQYTLNGLDASALYNWFFQYAFGKPLGAVVCTPQPNWASGA